MSFIDARLEAILSDEIADPHAVLGAHRHGDTTVVRTIRRGADRVELVLPTSTRPMTRVHPIGLFEATVDGSVTDYRLSVDGEPADDPYRHPPSLGELDLHLIGEGRHERLWTVLGARVRPAGVSFAVWAPRARAVRLVGDFVGWRVGDGLPMRRLGGSGVWEILVPDIGAGARYMYQVRGADGRWRAKADPLGRCAEPPPSRVSVVVASSYRWGDRAWLRQRAETTPLHRPVSVYEVHLASWRPGLSYLELADELVAYLDDLDFTHVEFLPVAAHPYGGSWGYQVTGYYAPDPRLGTPDEFRHLVDRLHRAGIGVILDWVPAHFPTDDWALRHFDGTPTYEHPDPRRGEHPDWGTAIFDFGRPEVRNFLVANALYWLEEFHVDGLRVDAVASMLYLDYSRAPGQWLPNARGGRENLEAVSLLQEVNATAYRLHPGIMMIAEESTAWPGVTRPTDQDGLGFGFKWDMGWMHDTLGYLGEDPGRRPARHHALTFASSYALSEHFVLPISHDEVVHGKGSLLTKMAGGPDAQRANLRALLAYMWAHPGKQLLFMGCEFGQLSEWSEQHGLAWEQADDRIRRLVRDLNRRYRREPALWSLDDRPEGFRWIDADDADGATYAFLRQAGDGSVVVCLTNLSDRDRDAHRVGLPGTGRWLEVINTDSTVYGGGGAGNLGVVGAEPLPWHGMPASAVLRLPALTTLWLRPESAAHPG
ncbi:1,4-alpha-glucan branching protein GlgB [Micromonospora sp. NPDC049171]|uniref:1,4-alpha-glucan branching protein GlgB n=1 Tax=Micromonospora sp. NPDC049171 TaxID=3155770 RepID=UPI00340BCE8E